MATRSSLNGLLSSDAVGRTAGPSTGPPDLDRVGGSIGMVRLVGTLLWARDEANSSDAETAAAAYAVHAPARRRAERQSTGKVARKPALPHRVTTEQRSTKPLCGREHPDFLDFANRQPAATVSSGCQGPIIRLQRQIGDTCGRPRAKATLAACGAPFTESAVVLLAAKRRPLICCDR